jgi:hypothetical protein
MFFKLKMTNLKSLINSHRKNSKKFVESLEMEQSAKSAAQPAAVPVRPPVQIKTF